jgi:hypothetical protein
MELPTSFEALLAPYARETPPSKSTQPSPWPIDNWITT